MWLATWSPNAAATFPESKTRALHPSKRDEHPGATALRLCPTRLAGVEPIVEGTELRRLAEPITFHRNVTKRPRPMAYLSESACCSSLRDGGNRLVRDIRGLRPERPLLPSPDVRSVATRTTAARPSPGTRLGASAEPVLMIGLASNERALPLQNCRPQVFKACAVVLCSRRGQSVQAGSSTWDYTPRRGVALSRLPAFPP